MYIKFHSFSVNGNTNKFIRSARVDGGQQQPYVFGEKFKFGVNQGNIDVFDIHSLC